MGDTSGRTKKEPERLEQVMKEPKVDLMELLPKGDVAQMQDVFDVMTSEEILNWKERCLLSYFEKTPALQSASACGNVNGLDLDLYIF